MGLVDLHFVREPSCLYEFLLPEMYGNDRSALWSGTIVFVWICTAGARVAAMVPYGKPKRIRKILGNRRDLYILEIILKLQVQLWGLKVNYMRLTVGSVQFVAPVPITAYNMSYMHDFSTWISQEIFISSKSALGNNFSWENQYIVICIMIQHTLLQYIMNTNIGIYCTALLLTETYQ